MIVTIKFDGKMYTVSVGQYICKIELSNKFAIRQRFIYEKL